MSEAEILLDFTFGAGVNKLDVLCLNLWLLTYASWPRGAVVFMVCLTTLVARPSAVRTLLLEES